MQSQSLPCLQLPVHAELLLGVMTIITPTNTATKSNANNIADILGTPFVLK
jgi:hypothetical protein